MYANIIILIVNIIFIYFYNKKIKYENDYEKEKNIYYKNKAKFIILLINIINILVNISYYSICYINNKINYIDLSVFIVYLLSFIIHLTIKKKKIKYKYISKKLINKFDILIILSLITIPISERLENNTELDLVYMILLTLIILSSLTIIIIKIIKYRKYLCYSIKENEYLNDIHFASKIEFNRIINHIIYISFYIVFVYAQIPFIYILYISILLLLIIVIKNKIKKIANETKRIYKKITIANENPGIIYAFQFTRDILFLKKLVITCILYLISIISVYVVGDEAFTTISIEFYLLLLYIIISDKIYLIRYIKSLNENFIDKKEYSINTTKKIDFIDTIKILNIKLYRIIIIDNIIYKSNIILYDPEISIKELKLKINKSNIEDYITIENKLYEE